MEQVLHTRKDMQRKAYTKRKMKTRKVSFRAEEKKSDKLKSTNPKRPAKTLR